MKTEKILLLALASIIFVGCVSQPTKMQTTQQEYSYIGTVCKIYRNRCGGIGRWACGLESKKFFPEEHCSKGSDGFFRCINTYNKEELLSRGCSK
jgi:hypothetical protein